ncbi:MAG: sulfurtransferase TusA family protein [Candidatus Dormibacteraeota bacterium]|nr:sulfurtransferase TusA family protein [Candidatus Dormibacteraeota bacterium]
MIEQRGVPTAELVVAATAEPAPARKFLGLLAARDFERLAASLASDAHARFLLPHGLEEYDGREAIVGRIRSWFGSAIVFDLISSTEDEVGMRHRISWRFNVVWDGGSRDVIEQLVYLNVGPQGVERIDLLCSGFQKELSLIAGPTQVFDAGDMGCADGLAQEFRRQIAKVSIGGSLEVVVSDPAAKEDLPSLVRLLGQRITSTEAHDDGRLTITVERQK